MSILVTILARAGSKGLPGKNIKLINGKPLIMWTVEQAKAWGKGQIVVSSDSLEICSMATNSSSSIIAFARHPKVAADNTPKIDSIRYVLKQIESYYERKFDTIIDLDVTNPLRLPDDIEKAFRQLINNDNEVLISVTNARRNPNYNQLQKWQDSYDLPIPSSFIRRQDAPNVYDVNSCIYVYQRDWLEEKEHIMPTFCLDTGIYLMQDWQAFDIDTEVDFKIVEFLMKEYGVCR